MSGWVHVDLSAGEVIPCGAAEQGNVRPPGSGQVRTSKHFAEISAVAELAGRHAEAGAELLPEVIFRIESAAPGNLGDFERAALQEARSLFQTLLFEEMTEKTASRAVELAGDVLARVSQLTSYGFDAQIFICTKPSSDAPHEGTKQTIHLRPPILWNRDPLAGIILCGSQLIENRPHAFTITSLQPDSR